MLVFSFNTSGLERSSKLKYFKWMIISLNPMVILLQETMMEGTKSQEVLEPWLKDWKFAYIRSDGELWGVVNYLELGFH